ncbi:hypothetical protein CEV34_1137 [Brucella pseudogrignonensis]|uniref:Uncharacterized protein n=3 Tax=Brucella TaxID=234 RepID=A0A256GMP7_9HYPH|nr:hypothetical protein CEV34_1137 [Brucella pseudogrignonensis]
MMMTWTANLDLMAATMAYNIVARKLAVRWLETQPRQEELAALIEELKNAAKGAHSENSLPPDIELRLVERMIVLIEEFFKELPSIDS